MKHLLAALTCVVALAIPCSSSASSTSQGSKSSTSTKKVYVHGYYRKDGTYVPPHYRNASGSGQSSSSGTTKGRTTGGANGGASSGTAGSTGHSQRCETCPRDEHGRIKRNEAARHEFMRKTGYPHGRPGYVVDHIIPLECGGADDPSNMQWQTAAEAKAKDKTEHLCRK